MRIPAFGRWSTMIFRRSSSWVTRSPSGTSITTDPPRSASRSGEALSGNTRRNLDEINASTRRLLHLVNSLLLLAAGDEGKLRIRPSPCDVATCLRRLTRNWMTAAQKGDLEILFVGPERAGERIIIEPHDVRRAIVAQAQ